MPAAFYASITTKGSHKTMKNDRFILFSCIVLLSVAAFLTSSNEAAAAYQEGEYSVPFQVLKPASDEISATSDYIVSPAKIRIEQGRMSAEVTLKNSAWWHEFKVHSSGSSQDVKVISEDEEAGTRLVQFPIEDLDQPLHAFIHIIVTGIPGFEYDNQYDIRFQFDSSQIPLAVKEEESSDGEPNTSPDTKTGSESEAADPHTESLPNNEPSLDTPVEVNQEVEAEEEETSGLEEADTGLEREQVESSEMESPDAEPPGVDSPDAEASDLEPSEHEPSEADQEIQNNEEHIGDSNTGVNNTTTILLTILVLGIIIGAFFLWRARREK